MTRLVVIAGSKMIRISNKTVQLEEYRADSPVEHFGEYLVVRG